MCVLQCVSSATYIRLVFQAVSVLLNHVLAKKLDRGFKSPFTDPGLVGPEIQRYCGNRQAMLILYDNCMRFASCVPCDGHASTHA